jgi:hypothetical protein
MRNSPTSLFALALAALATHAAAQNDDCAGALPVVLGANGPFSTVGATTSTPAWPCAFNVGPDIWFVYTAPAAGQLVVNTCGSAYDTTLEIFDACGGTSLGCNDDNCGLQSQLTVNVNAGQVFIRVGGYNGATGTLTLNVGIVSATNTTLGTGCGAAFGSFYEFFATSASFDLSNTAITWLPTGTSYLVLPGVTSYVAPSAGATVVTLGDDGEAPVALSAPFAYPGGSTSSLTVCSNGFVSVSSANGTGFTPSSTTLLNDPATSWRNWHDHNPAAAGSGQVKFEQIGAIAYITWDGVYDYQVPAPGPANANTFQFQFDTATGAVHLVFQTMSALGNARLVGYSPGGPSPDPGSIDLSAVLPNSINLPPTEALPLALVASTTPITGTSWNLEVSEVPPSATIGIEVFGLSDPAILDLGIIGAPGCQSRASLDVLNVWVVSGSPTHSYALAIPATPALLNFHVFTQAAALVPGINTFLGGTITSNGIDGGIGDI